MGFASAAPPVGSNLSHLKMLSSAKHTAPLRIPAMENRREDGDMECETVPKSTCKKYLQVRQEDTERKKLTKSKSGKRKGGK